MDKVSAEEINARFVDLLADKGDEWKDKIVEQGASFLEACLEDGVFHGEMKAMMWGHFGDNNKDVIFSEVPVRCLFLADAVGKSDTVVPYAHERCYFKVSLTTARLLIGHDYTNGEWTLHYGAEEEFKGTQQCSMHKERLKPGARVSAPEDEWNTTEVGS